jgi:hypothetical protein
MFFLASGESNTQRLVDEDCVPDDVPGIAGLLDSVFSDSDRSILSECSKLRAGSRSPLQPQDQRHSSIGLGGRMPVGREQTVIHGGLSFGVVPVYLFVA